MMTIYPVCTEFCALLYRLRVQEGVLPRGPEAAVRVGADRAGVGEGDVGDGAGVGGADGGDGLPGTEFNRPFF